MLSSLFLSVLLPLALGVQENGASFEGSMLKLLRTLPKVLKYLPMDKAAVCVCMCVYVRKAVVYSALVSASSTACVCVYMLHVLRVSLCV